MPGSVSQQHTHYSKFLKKWETMRDCYNGQDTIKDAGVKYLPPTAAMEYDGMTGEKPGLKAYNAYKGRAVFPDVVSDAVELLGGMAHREQALIELPAKMEPLLKSATKTGQTLQQLLEMITEAQLKTGRLGIMADWPADAVSGTLPYIVIKNETSLINWDLATHDDGEGRAALGLVVIDECGDVRDGFEWKHRDQYRVLALSCIAAELTGDKSLEAGDDRYMIAVVEGDRAVTADDFIEVNSGRGTVNEILFEFVNACDTAPDPDKPPLGGLANMALTIYRGEADYRQSLFMQGQDTLVVKGRQRPAIVEGSTSAEAEGDVRTGTGAVINVKPDGDAKYIGVNGQGLGEQRQAIENDYARAGAAGAKLLDSSGGGKEGAEALHIRVSTRTATLPRISSTGAAALESLLKRVARSMNLNPDEVKIEPNKDFAALPTQAADVLQLVQAKLSGLQISDKSIHDYARRKDLTRLKWDDEQTEIAGEPSKDDLGNGAGVGDDDLVDDNEDD